MQWGIKWFKTKSCWGKTLKDIAACIAVMLVYKGSKSNEKIVFNGMFVDIQIKKYA